MELNTIIIRAKNYLYDLETNYFMNLGKAGTRFFGSIYQLLHAYIVSTAKQLESNNKALERKTMLVKYLLF